MSDTIGKQFGISEEREQELEQLAIDQTALVVLDYEHNPKGEINRSDIIGNVMQEHDLTPEEQSVFIYYLQGVITSLLKGGDEMVLTLCNTSELSYEFEQPEIVSELDKYINSQIKPDLKDQIPALFNLNEDQWMDLYIRMEEVCWKYLMSLDHIEVNGIELCAVAMQACPSNELIPACSFIAGRLMDSFENDSEACLANILKRKATRSWDTQKVVVKIKSMIDEDPEKAAEYARNNLPEDQLEAVVHQIRMQGMHEMMSNLSGHAAGMHNSMQSDIEQMLSEE